MAMGFTACTQNEDMAPTLKGQEINATFSVGGMQTRVNTLGDGKNWEDKDKLKVSTKVSQVNKYQLACL